MVAVYNAGENRMMEYTPTPGDDKYRGGGGEKYARFLIIELKPFIDGAYRTLPDRENTAVAGSSLGGLSSLYLALRHGDKFGSAAVISPSLWWDRDWIINKIAANPSAMKNERIWLDMGTAESRSPDTADSSVRNARRLAKILKGVWSDDRHFNPDFPDGIGLHV